MKLSKRNTSKVPKEFIPIYIVAIVIAIIIALLLPVATPWKTMIGMVLVVGFSLLGVWIYVKHLRK